jgi:hypothetical protein
MMKMKRQIFELHFAEELAPPLATLGDDIVSTSFTSFY